MFITLSRVEYRAKVEEVNKGWCGEDIEGNEEEKSKRIISIQYIRKTDESDMGNRQ